MCQQNKKVEPSGFDTFLNLLSILAVLCAFALALMDRWQSSIALTLIYFVTALRKIETNNNTRVDNYYHDKKPV